MAIHGPQQTYSQSLDTATSGCRQNPALCVPQPGEQLPTVPSPPAPRPPASLPPPLSSAQSAALSIGAAGRIVQVAMDATLLARIQEALSMCADTARSEVLLKHFEGRGPTQAECNEVVGTDKRGEPITRAMQLGIEQHKLALQCTLERLSELKPGGFSLSPRYRFDKKTGLTTHIPPEEVNALIAKGRTMELRGTLEPDVVIHTGNPLRIQTLFDFKFPCVNGGDPGWRRYPEGSPHQGRDQGTVYQEALGAKPWRVLPRWGVRP
jgi:hypothetical protein